MPLASPRFRVRFPHGLLALTLLALAPLHAAPARADSLQPNILFILADDVGQEVLGSYGGTSYPTPTLDRLARQGLRFNHVYSAPVCHPSRITLLTGRYPLHVGNPKWGSFPKACEGQTVARQLQEAGYVTAIAGKWQLTLLKDDSNHPHRLGFDTYCLFGWHEGPRYYQPHLWQDGALRADVAKRYGPDVYTDFLIDFMMQSGEQPFFAFYSMALCHAVSDDFDPPPPYGSQGRYETFGEMVGQMDRQVGRLLSALDHYGLTDNTLVLFTTDNGSPSSTFVRHDGERFQSEQVVSSINGEEIPGAKGKLTDWGIRVPTLARWPGQITAGSVTSALIDFSDFMPTFLELAGADPLPFPIDGRSFAPVLEDASATTRDWIFSQSLKAHCVATRDWKLTDQGKLYALSETAPRETLIDPDRDTRKSAAARRSLQGQLDSLAHP